MELRRKLNKLNGEISIALTGTKSKMQGKSKQG